MSGIILTANCSDAALKECSSQFSCPDDASSTIDKSIRGQLWRVNTLLVVEAVLAAVIVVIGAYGQRYRHRPITRFLFLGATTLFLPIISYVASTISNQPNYISTLPSSSDYQLSAAIARCGGNNHVAFLVVLASLVQIVMINTSTIVCVDDREGECKGPPLELLVQAVWTFYLYLSILERFRQYFVMSASLVAPYALLCSKIGLQYFAFEKARRSVALGRNPGLVLVYMQQLQAREEADQHVDEPLAGEEGAPPPPLLVMRESQEQVQRHPRGYAFKDDSGTMLSKNGGSVVTVDRVWQLDGMFPVETPWLKDLCLSFALFKLLRCRFARHKLTNSGSVGTLNFFRSLLLKAGEHDDWVFAVIVEELSFVHDYYYSSLPISYSKGCLPILSIFLSLLTIGYCILVATTLIVAAPEGPGGGQLFCIIWCVTEQLISEGSNTNLGEWYFDSIPLLFILVLVVTAEIKNMASYICSNWTKMEADGALGRRNEPVFCSGTSTENKLLVRRLLRLPDHRRKVKVPAAVKACIMSAIRSSFNRGLSNGAESLRRSQGGESFLWACSGKGTSDIILTWHIATCILEVKHPYHADDQEQGSPTNPSSSDYKIAAIHLSKYCAYLVSWCPELLPDTNSAWSQSLYKAVKKDAECALMGRARSSEPEDEYQKLVDLLGANSEDEVLKNSVKLGKQLAETINGEEMLWKLLADFWSEMILYVAPSENLKGHSEAIARGGELITLLWALLFHAGIVSRPGEEDGAVAPPSSGAV